MIIVTSSFSKDIVRFQNVFRPNEDEKPAISNSSGSKSVFQKLCLRDGFAWIVAPTVQIKLRFSNFFKAALIMEKVQSMCTEMVHTKSYNFFKNQGSTSFFVKEKKRSGSVLNQKNIFVFHNLPSERKSSLWLVQDFSVR